MSKEKKKAERREKAAKVVKDTAHGLGIAAQIGLLVGGILVAAILIYLSVKLGVWISQGIG